MTFFTTLGVVLVLLKLTGCISLSWGWVLTPFIPLALVCLLALIWVVR